MIPDYDYTLTFPVASRTAVIEGIKKLCDDESHPKLEAAKSSVGKIEVEVSFRSLPDMPEEIVKEFRLLSEGTYALGYVYLTIEPADEYNQFPDGVVFRIWPCTRRLQHAIIGSAIMRDELIGLLEQHNGHVGLIMLTGEGVEFWHETTGRTNYIYPPEYFVPKLSVHGKLPG